MQYEPNAPAVDSPKLKTTKRNTHLAGGELKKYKLQNEIPCLVGGNLKSINCKTKSLLGRRASKKVKTAKRNPLFGRWESKKVKTTKRNPQPIPLRSLNDASLAIFRRSVCRTFPYDILYVKQFKYFSNLPVLQYARTLQAVEEEALIWPDPFSEAATPPERNLR